MNQLILVNTRDQPIGYGKKMDVHRRGLLHRGFSVVIWRHHGQKLEFLLQRRALTKYHSNGLWSNTCCGHPTPYQRIETCATQRLFEEMGFIQKLSFVDSFEYHANLENGLIEHEITHVFQGIHQNAEIRPSPNEVMEYKWEQLVDLTAHLKNNPKQFTAWSPRVFKCVAHFLSKVDTDKQGSQTPSRTYIY